MARPIDPASLSSGVRALADTLTNRMETAIMKAVRPVAKAIASDIRSGDFSEAQARARDLDFNDAVIAQKGRVQAFSRQAALLGAGAIDRPQTSLWAQGAPFPWEVDEGAVRQVMTSVKDNLSDNSMRRLDERITAASRFRKADPIDPNKLARGINRFLRGEIRRVVDVAANATGTRVSAYGMLYEARARGISEYRIDAILDDSTTEICRFMDGKTFSVEEAFIRTGQVLSTVTPEQQKKVAPFPPNTTDEIARLGELSEAELQARGFDTPPFHLLCRSVVTLIRNDVEYDPVAWSNYPQVGDYQKGIRANKPQYDRAALDLYAADDLDDLFQTALKSDVYSDVDPISATNAYTGNLYDTINENLRRNRQWDADSVNPAVVKELDDLFDRNAARAPDVTYTYRGVKSAQADRLTMGSVFQDDGFVSTTMDASVAADYAGAGKGAILQIQVGTGQKVLPAYAASLTPFEYELMLPRGTQYRVVGRATQKLDGEDVTVIRVVIQGEGDTLAPNKVGDSDLPEASSLVKELAPGHGDKFVYDLNDLRPAEMR